MFKHRCEGGPLDGQEIDSRYPMGFLLVDKPNGQCWLYERLEEIWVLRNGYPQPWDREKSWEAALGQEFDVRAVSE